MHPLNLWLQNPDNKSRKTSKLILPQMLKFQEIVWDVLWLSYWYSIITTYTFNGKSLTKNL